MSCVSEQMLKEACKEEGDKKRQPAPICNESLKGLLNVVKAHKNGN